MQKPICCTTWGGQRRRVSLCLCVWECLAAVQMVTDSQQSVPTQEKNKILHLQQIKTPTPNPPRAAQLSTPPKGLARDD